MKEVFTQAQIKEQNDAMTEEETIAKVVSHEAGHAIVGMLHGYIPNMAMVSLHGTYGFVEFAGWQTYKIEQDNTWDIHIAGYWANKTFMDFEDRSFFILHPYPDPNNLSDWDKTGNMSKTKIDKACDLITREMDRLWLPINEVYELITQELSWNGVIYQPRFEELFNEYFGETENKNIKTWADYHEWWTRYHRRPNVA